MGHDAHQKVIVNADEARQELLAVGVDEEGVPFMAPKMRHMVIKLKAVDVRAANILKQEMLANGGEAAVGKWSSGFRRETTDVLLMGTVKQIRQMLKKARLQPYGIPAIGQEISGVLDNLSAVRKPWSGHRDSQSHTVVMGILNVTPDSFSDGGLYRDAGAALDHALEMVEQGADIIDIGGESTRPGAESVPEKDELARVIPVLSRLRDFSDVAISIDTMKANVAREALAAGAGIVNDVGGLLRDPRMAEVAAEGNAAVIIMHMLGEPRTMQKHPVYDDLMADICGQLIKGAERALEHGLRPVDIALDPGVGFGKTVAQNLEIIKRLREIASLGYAVALGTSRKATIGAVLGTDVDNRLGGTAATVAAGVLAGAQILRVHDVKEMAMVAKMTDAITTGGEWVE